MNGIMNDYDMQPYEAWVRAQFTRGNRVFQASKQHMPKWLVALMPIALMIPGPQDEIIVAAIIAVWAAFKPQMRADMKVAWNIYG